MQSVSLRRLGELDSFDELTEMLHRAFSRLRQMGLNCTCIDQSVAVTRERIDKGECYVAVCNGRLVGTITLYGPDPASESAWYHQRAVASIHQLGVDPEFQGRGLGSELLRLAERWARDHGYKELALDTPQPAKNLVAFYRAHGYRFAESLRFKGKQYRSVVLSKAIVEPSITHVRSPSLQYTCAVDLRSRPLDQGEMRDAAFPISNSRPVSRRIRVEPGLSKPLLHHRN